MKSLDCSKVNCFACENGKCKALTESYGDKMCPFYKEKKVKKIVKETRK